MKAQSPALTPADLASAAGRKALKVQKKLHEAEAELHTANSTLVTAIPTQDKEDIDTALQQNAAAEEKVHDAAEELEVVKELLTDAQDHREAPAAPKPVRRGKGKSGQGVKSLMTHLAKRPSTRP